MKQKIMAILVLFVVSCSTPSDNDQQSEKTPKKPTTSKSQPKIQQKAGPTYETFYSPETVELDNVSYTGKMDQEVALKIVVNSCNDVKADFLNYMMDAYKTVEPAASQIEPMFDAEHIGKFIVWQLTKKDTDCFPEIFSALNEVFKNADEDALMLAKYGIYQMMIYESRRLDVNYNSAFNHWLSGPTHAQWFALIDEMESGRS